MEKTNRLVKNTLLLSIGNFSTKAINLIMIPLFSSWLSAEDYGTFDLIVTYAMLLIPVLTLSNSDSIFRLSIDKEDNKKNIYITNGLFINIIGIIIISVILYFISILTSWTLGLPFIFLLIVEIMNNHLQGCMRALKKLNIYSLFSVISTFFIVIFVTIFVQNYKLGLQGMIYGYALGYSISCLLIINLIKYWKYISLNKISLKYMKELISYSLPLVPNNISWWFINVSDRILINLVLGPAANGIYAIACKIPNFCTSIFSTFSISWQETATELIEYEDKNIINNYYNIIYNKTISIMISLCGGILSLNFLLFEYVFDIRYSKAALYSPILVTAVLFTCITQYFGGIQIGLKRAKENGISTIIGATSNIIINAILIKFIGLYAAALSTLFSNAIISMLRKVKLNKEIKFKIHTENYIYILIYIYLFISCYIFSSNIMASINFIIATVLFCIINISFIKKLFNKTVFIYKSYLKK